MKILHDAMLDDTEIPGSTAYRAFHPLLPIRVCSKTGTAQVAADGKIDKSKQTTWFLSFAPYEQPRYAVVVMVEGGMSGGDTCAPVGRKIYEAILQMEKEPALRTGSLAQAH